MASEDPPQRGSAGSGRSSGGGSGGSGGSAGRQQNPPQQLSTIEKSVTHLLVATKQLLETLTMWSRGSATETEVSDVYVRLGYEFNIACRAFNAIAVDTSDLGPVPDLLRRILEDTLSQEASQASLDKYLPRIRDIIINLLHGLKKKQQRLRQRNAPVKDGPVPDARPPRQPSTASNASAESNLTQQLDDIPSRVSSVRSFAQPQGAPDFSGMDPPPRTTSVQTRRSSPRRQTIGPHNIIQQPTSQDSTQPDPPSLPSNNLPSIPTIAPYPESDTMPDHQQLFDEPDQPSPDPPQPPPKQNDALSALQRGGELERRASRRFSQYQINKALGTNINGIGGIPPPQNSPVPNRGRDVRESMSAVRSRGSVMQNRARSRAERAGYEPSPNRLHEVRRISEEPASQNDEPSAPSASNALELDEPLDSPTVKTPDDKLAAYPFPRQNGFEKIGATLNGPMEEPFIPDVSAPASGRRKAAAALTGSASRPARQTPPPSQYIPEGSPQAGKELTLFLQYKSKIKKFVLPDGGDLTIGRLQLAFIEKFAWNTHSNGADLPEIYIQDQVSGVRHELEDLGDIKERCVLVLNVEVLDEVKKHFDDSIGGLRRIVEDIRTSVDDQQTAIQHVSDRQQETAKNVAGLAAAPLVAAAPASAALPLGRKSSVRDRTSQLTEVQSLRRDLAVLRQTYTSFQSELTSSMTAIRGKAASVKKVAAESQSPEMDENTGRAHVNRGKKALSDDSEKIVNRVDDLQDLVEDLRKDVVTRGVRPLPRQLESVSKDISLATSELKKLQEFLRKEKPVWSKIWEKELQVVCEERDLLTMQEELAADLENDLEEAAQTFALVEQATKQQSQSLTPATGAGAGAAVAGSRSPSRSLRPVLPAALDQGADPLKAKDSVLGEVRALQPNHESRLEAIERAERSRQRELESRKGGEFQRELGTFVEEGRLKKSGGVEEVERVRKQREERAKREWAELQASRRRAREEPPPPAAEPDPAFIAAPDGAEGVPPLPPLDSAAVPSDIPAEATFDDERPNSPEPLFVEAEEAPSDPGHSGV